MGFSYTCLGLCCDFCNNSGPKENVRKIACPYGFCQAWACCNVCYKAKKHLQSSCSMEPKKHSEICKELAEKFDNTQNELKRLTVTPEIST